MKNLISVSFFLFIFITIYSCRTENPHEVERDKSGKFILEKDDGSFAIIGTKMLYDYNQIYFMTIDELGNFQSSYRFGTIHNEEPVCMHRNYNGDFAVLTISEPNQVDEANYRYIICDDEGEPYDFHNLTEEHAYGINKYYASGMVRNPNNTYTITGNYFVDEAPSAFTVRIHEDGTLYSFNFYDFACSAEGIETTINGENVITGGQNKNAFLFKINAGGDTLWTQSYDFEAKAIGKDIIQTSDEGFLISGTHGENDEQTFLLRTTSKGDSLWSQVYNGSFPNNKGFDVLLNNELIFALNEGNGFSLMKTDPIGNPLWKRSFFTNDNKVTVNCIQPTLDNGFILTGDILNSNGVSYIYISKFDEWGNQIWKTGL